MNHLLSEHWFDLTKHLLNVVIRSCIFFFNRVYYALLWLFRIQRRKLSFLETSWAIRVIAHGFWIRRSKTALGANITFNAVGLLPSLTDEWRRHYSLMALFIVDWNIPSDIIQLKVWCNLALSTMLGLIPLIFIIVINVDNSILFARYFLFDLRICIQMWLLCCCILLLKNCRIITKLEWFSKNGWRFLIGQL